MKYFLVPEYTKCVFRPMTLIGKGYGGYTEPEIAAVMSPKAKVFWLTVAAGRFPEKAPGGYTLVEVDGNAALYTHPKKGEMLVDLESLLSESQQTIRKAHWTWWSDTLQMCRKYREKALEAVKATEPLLWEISEFEEEIIEDLGKNRTTKWFSTWSRGGKAVKEYLREHPCARIKYYVPEDVDPDDHSPLWDPMGRCE